MVETGSPAIQLPGSSLEEAVYTYPYSEKIYDDVLSDTSDHITTTFYLYNKDGYVYKSVTRDEGTVSDPSFQKVMRAVKSALANSPEGNPLPETSAETSTNGQ